MNEVIDIAIVGGGLAGLAAANALKVVGLMNMHTKKSPLWLGLFSLVVMTGMWLERLGQDARYAARSLRRATLFAVTAILTLALGIGVTTAMFTVVRSVLLRPLPFAEPGELYAVSHMPDHLRGILGAAMPDREYDEFARYTKTFRSTSSFRTYPVTLLGASEPARVPAAAVTPGFFATLGIPVILGRDFTVNAIAFDLNDNSLHDPTGGGKDLIEKQLRACSPSAFTDDPVRILRGIRLAASFSFTIQAETRQGMKEAVSRLVNVSPERLRDVLIQRGIVCILPAD